MCLAEGARPKAIRERSSMTLKTFHPLFSRRCLVAPLWVLNVFLEMSRQIASQGCTKKAPMKPLTESRAKLGFVGLGHMGSLIAQRLLNRGYQLTAYDLELTQAQALAARGGIVAKSVLELAQSVDVILSCL